MNEIRIALTSKQTVFDRRVAKVENVLFGGAKGGGKSFGLREIMLKRRIQNPGSYGVIFRKTYPALYNNHIMPLLTKFPILRERYSSKHKEICFENGSKLAFRHCQYQKDLELYQGQEFHDLAIEEAGEWPESWFWTLKGSNRSGVAGITPRCLLTGNPGGVGHKWLKRLFIDRNFRKNEDPENFAFVRSRVYDNPAVMKNDPGYLDRLKANKNPLLVKAYLEGSWDIMAGQYFDVLSRDVHMIDPFQIPDHWERMGMLDYGYNHPSAFYLMATDTDGNSYVYWEYVRSRRRPEEMAKDLLEHEDIAMQKIGSVPAGWDCWAKHGGGPSVAEKISEASNYKITLHKAKIDRIAGAHQVRDYLAYDDDMQPRVKIFKTCPILFDCLGRMTHDERRPEDVLKVDADDGDPWTGDDPYDAFRMGLMDRPKIAVEPEEPSPRRYYDDDEDTDGNWTTV